MISWIYFLNFLVIIWIDINILYTFINHKWWCRIILLTGHLRAILFIHLFSIFNKFLFITLRCWNWYFRFILTHPNCITENYIKRNCPHIKDKIDHCEIIHKFFVLSNEFLKFIYFKLFSTRTLKKHPNWWKKICLCDEATNYRNKGHNFPKKFCEDPQFDNSSINGMLFSKH